MVTAQPAARARRSMMTLPSSRARSSSVATVFKKEVLGNALKGERRRERRTGKKTADKFSFFWEIGRASCRERV